MSYHIKSYHIISYHVTCIYYLYVYLSSIHIISITCLYHPPFQEDQVMDLHLGAIPLRDVFRHVPRAERIRKDPKGKRNQIWIPKQK
jgi:hypothetical protein